MTPQELIALKQRNLIRMTSTVRRDFGFANAHNRAFQVDTPQPLPAYPDAGAGPIEIARLQVPSGMGGKVAGLAIAHIGAAGSFMDGSGNLVWHIFVNGAPVKGLENIYAQIGQLAQPADVSILLQQNDLVQVLVEVPAAKVKPVGNPIARLVGFFDFGGTGNQLPRGASAVSQAQVPAGAGTSGGSGSGSGSYSGGAGSGSGGGSSPVGTGGSRPRMNVL
jgi:hypothetical protein